MAKRKMTEVENGYSSLIYSIKCTTEPEFDANFRYKLCSGQTGHMMSKPARVLQEYHKLMSLRFSFKIISGRRRVSTT